MWGKGLDQGYSKGRSSSYPALLLCTKPKKGVPAIILPAYDVLPVIVCTYRFADIRRTRGLCSTILLCLFSPCHKSNDDILLLHDAQVPKYSINFSFSLSLSLSFSSGTHRRRLTRQNVLKYLRHAVTSSLAAIQSFSNIDFSDFFPEISEVLQSHYDFFFFFQ